jgi:hypothetical protein
LNRIILVVLNILLFCASLGYTKSEQINIVDYSKYTAPRSVIESPSYSAFLHLDEGQVMTKFWMTIRQASTAYPGDYFYPPDTYFPTEALPTNLIAMPKSSDLKVIKNFLNDETSEAFYYSPILSSVKCYNFDYPNGHHREPYTMLTDADTVYVVSGWLDKFLSFYRVVPGDKRLTVPQLMTELEKITPLSKEIDQKKFRTESDSANYLLEYVDKDKMFRVRNYLIKATLPPDSSDAPESYHNLIEVTKFYDKEAIP